MKSGTVALIGRPNVGKSTLVNNLIGQKIAITSPKPQTTRFPIYGLLNDPRGQVIFIDTPGIFRKTKDVLSKKINQRTLTEIEKEIDVFLYIIDPTRPRDFEEARVLGIVRALQKPKILVINKIDQPTTYLAQFQFLKSEFTDIVELSALTKKHLKTLLNLIFEKLPEKQPVINTANYTYPALNLDSKLFLSELIREKIFLRMRKEVPYTTMVVVDEIVERSDKMLYIKARILTTDDKYKKMLIGFGGRKIKEIGSMARREIEVSTNKKVYLELNVETDKHWVQTLI